MLLYFQGMDRSAFTATSEIIKKIINANFYEKIPRKLLDSLYFKNSIFYLIGPWKLFLPIKISDLFVKGNNYFATAELGILSWKVILK